MSDVMTWVELRDRVAYLRKFYAEMAALPEALPSLLRCLEMLLAKIDAAAEAMAEQEHDARLWRFAISDQGWGLNGAQLEEVMRKREEGGNDGNP